MYIQFALITSSSSSTFALISSKQRGLRPSPSFDFDFCPNLIEAKRRLRPSLSSSTATRPSPSSSTATITLVFDFDFYFNFDPEIDFDPRLRLRPRDFGFDLQREHRQNEGGNTTRGWAVFGVISCVFIVSSILFCCGGFVYKTRVKNLCGLDALPGMTFLSACLETVSGGGHGYSRPEDLNNSFVNQASWERLPASAQGTSRTSERTYGSI